MLLGSPHKLHNAGSLALFVDGVALELHSMGVSLDSLEFEPF